MTSTSTTDGFYTSPVYKYSTATVPLSKEVLDDYKKTITDEIFRESPFLTLLKKKTEKAAEEMRNELNQTMWGSGPPVTKQSLREIISDAYDLHTKEKEKMSNAVDKVMAERAEDRAREALLAVDEWLEEYEIGSVRSWTVQFTAGGKVYNYAAVFAGDGVWYITNRNGGVKTEGFKAILAEWAVEAHEVVIDEATIL